MTDSSINLSMAQVADLTSRALAACGAHGEQLEVATQSVVDAELDGIRTVGLNYLPLYCEHLLCGKLNADAQPRLEQGAASAVVVNADNGFAHVGYTMAEQAFYDAAASNGVAAMSIIDSYSAGVVGWFVDRIAQQGMIGMAFANSPTAVSPAEGAPAFFGTNPMAFSIPRSNGQHVIADMATSQVALVTIKKHAAEGKPIPLGWGYDSAGKPTTDANAVVNGGSLAPAGGYKGTLLAMLVDVLAGVVAGPFCSYQAPMFRNTEGGYPRVGQFFLAINPGSFGAGGQDAAAARLEAMIDALTESPNVRLPGARRHETRQSARENGVDVAKDLFDKLNGYANR